MSPKPIAVPRFIEVNVRTASVIHGYDAQNRELVEQLAEEAFVTKVIAVDRIQSVSPRYLLVSGTHGRFMYWEFSDAFEHLKRQLLSLPLEPEHP